MRAPVVMPVGDPVAVTVRFRSDWQVGSGAGQPGGADLLVRRRRGRPYFPGSSLRGLWREGCTLAAVALDDDQSRGWAQWCSALFGTSGRPGLVRVGPAVASAAVPVAVRASTAIDPTSGAAATGSLRFEEVAAPTDLTASVILVPAAGWDDEGVAAATVLLGVGAALVDRAGGGRRRGLGAAMIRIDLEGLDLEALLEALLEAAAKPPPPPPAATLGAPPGGPVAGRPGGSACDGGADPAEQRTVAGAPPAGWTRRRAGEMGIRVVFETVTPLVAAVPARGNHLGSRDHIPGSTVLAWLAGRLADHGVDPSAWVQAGGLRAGPATPVATGRPGMAVPLCWRRAEGTGEVRNRLVDPEPPESRERAIRAGFVAPDPDGWSPAMLVAAATGIDVHPSVDPSTQAAVPGGLYSVGYLREQQTFASDITVDQELADLAATVAGSRWWSMWEGTAWLGGKANGEYGQARVRAEATPPFTPTDDPAATEPAADRGETDLRSGPRSLTVWATSDVLIRDDRLRLSTSPTDLAATLAAALGLPDSTRIGPAAPGLIAGACESVRVDGWHRPSGLPRPTLAGLRAGSVLRLVWHGPPIAGDRRRQVEREGIGERRAEGFGRVLIDPPLLVDGHPEVAPGWSEPDRADPAAHPPGPDRLATPAAPTPLGERGPSAPPPLQIPTQGDTDAPTGGLTGGVVRQWRAALEVDLVAVSDLHVGGNRPPPPSSDDRDEAVPARFARRADDMWVIPGTSLAGVLRQVCDTAGLPLAARFGDTSAASELYVDDAVVPAGTVTATVTRAGIDRRSGAAADGTLFATEVVPAGTRLTLDVSSRSGEDISADLANLVEVLAARGLSVGQSTSRGAGRLAYQAHRIRVGEVTTLGGLRRWLTPPEPPEGTNPAVAGRPPWAAPPGAAPGRFTVCMEWRPIRGMLVSAGKPLHDPAGGEVIVPRLRHRGTVVSDGREVSEWVAVLPGTAIAGALRSRAARIARTALGTGPARIDAKPSVHDLRRQIEAEPALLRRLFGDPGRRSAVDIPDVACRHVVTGPTGVDPHTGPSAARVLDRVGRPRSHVAIDRWTGAALDGALWRERSADTAAWEPMTLNLDTVRLGDAWPAAACLLLVALAELATGALTLGGRGTRGLGAIKITAATIHHPRRHSSNPAAWSVTDQVAAGLGDPVEEWLIDQGRQLRSELPASRPAWWEWLDNPDLYRPDDSDGACNRPG